MLVCGIENLEPNNNIDNINQAWSDDTKDSIILAYGGMLYDCDTMTLWSVF